MGGPQGPARKSTQSDQSRIAKATTLAVTIRRRGTASRSGCDPMGLFDPGRELFMFPFSIPVAIYRVVFLDFTR
jgi:hypothetical protein